MNREVIPGLVARFVADAERRFGADADPWLLYRQITDAVWDWWRDTPGTAVGTARLVLHEVQIELDRRAAAYLSAELERAA